MSRSGVLAARIHVFQNTTPLRDALEALFRRRSFLVAGCLIFTSAFLGFMLARPRYFESQIIFFVKSDRAPIEVSPYQTPVAAQEAPDDSRVGTEIQLLLSQDLHRQVIQDLHDKSAPGQKLSDGDWSRMLKEFEAKLKIVPIAKTNLIRVTYTAQDRDGAQEALRDLSNRYLAYHLKLHGAGGAYEFFSQQTGLFQEQLANAQSQLAQFEQQNRITLLGEQKDLDLRKLTDLRTSLDSTKTEREENEQESLKILRQLNQVAPRITTQQRTVPNQYSVDRMNTMLVELRNKRTGLLTKFKPEDRLVQEVDRQIADTRQALAKAEKMTGTEEATDVNPLRQTMEGALAKSEVNASSLRAREDGLRRQVQANEEELAKLNQATDAHEKLERDVKEAEGNYELYQRKREEARIGGALDKDKIANVTVAEGPTRPPVANPRFTLATVCGLFLGNLCIAGLALFSGLRHAAVYTPWDLEAFADIPVLATVPFKKGASVRALPERLELYLPELGDGTMHGLD